MKVSGGVRLGLYEILSAIGAGGMGEVWKARDTKLRRTVAIKTLPEALANDPDRLARLEREAELLASLNHPNIAIIHGLDEHDGTRFLVLEFVDGDTLQERLSQGPIPVREALTLGLQMAEALETAHEKGVVHRDLKPANVKVTPEGRIKVLDFGLAKALAPASADQAETAIATQPGIAVGTPAYMSPEQARGETAGPQADIWSFGVVMYELLTGASPFKQNTTAETLAKLLEAQPDYSGLPLAVPATARQLIRRCLEKDRRRRVQHMGDVRIGVEEALAALDSPPAEQTTREATAGTRWLWGGALLVGALAGLAGWALGVRSTSAVPAIAARLSIPFFARPGGWPMGTRHLAMSRDGSHVAFAAGTRIFLRRIDQKDPVILAEPGSNPVFSPDGKWLGLFDATDGLKKIPVDGGPSVTIARTSARPAGAAWRPDGIIVFGTTEGLFQVSQDGGEVRLLIKPESARKERLYAWPEFLPGGGSVLFTVVLEGPANECEIAVLDLKTLERRVILKGGSDARFVRPGYLFYAAGKTMKAVAFDPDAQRLLGEAVSLPDIEVAIAPDNGVADIALSETGTLAFLSPAGGGPGRTLTWIDRGGQRQPLAVEPGEYGYPRVSPDGTRVALDINRDGSRDIWILNLERLSLTRLTDHPAEDILPVWSEDSQLVLFASNRSGNFDLYSQPADGASGARVEFAGPGTQMTGSLTPDGRQLLVYEEYKDQMLLTFGRPERLTPLLVGDAEQRQGKVSPDGRWIAYESDEAGTQFEIFLRPFPNVSERREKISIDGGRFPLWGPPGAGELYYVSLTGDMMAASVTLAPALRLGPVTKLFDFQKPPAGRSGSPYDVAADGRFLTTQSVAAGSPAPTQVSIVLNWADDLQKQMARR